jgi:heterodisulfide reductase subunit B
MGGQIMEYAFFRGCLAPIREYGYELSVRNILRTLNVQLVDVEDFSCCAPACLFYSFDFTTGVALTARNLCVAEEKELDILTMCSSCFSNLSKTRKLLTESPELKQQVNEILSTIDKEFVGNTEVKHVVTVLFDDIGVNKIKEAVTNPLKGIRAAAFYGCHLIRPHDVIKFDDSELPYTLDKLIEVTGAESIYYKEKVGCCIGCGAFFGGVGEQVASRLLLKIVKSAKKAKADCIVVTCPFCAFQLDLGQFGIAENEETEAVPILYYTDLLGLALGLQPDELGVTLHRVDVTPLLEKIKS